MTRPAVLPQSARLVSCSILVLLSCLCLLVLLPPIGAQSTAPTPWYSATFDTSFSTSPSGWSYLSSDPSDTSCGITSHSGLLVLPGRTQPGNGDPYGYSSNGPYVNLSTTGGNNGYTTALPGNIGGVGAGNVTLGTAGWTFEVAFKPTLLELWAKVFDLGQSQVYGGLCQYDILWGWDANGQNWQFDVCDGQGNQYAIVDTLGPVNLNQWYHATVVISLLPSGLATYSTYVNGQFYTALADVYYPDLVPRWNANMGKSNWIADTYWAGEVDFFNIYNQALTPAQIAARYSSTFGTQPSTCGNTAQSSSVAPPAPFYSANFSVDPRIVTGLGNSARYNWLAADPTDYQQDQALHTGLVALGGSFLGSAIGAGPYINLSATSGSYWVGSTLPQFGGLGSGSLYNGTAGWSVELVFKAQQATTWAKIFDLGNPQTSGGVCFGDVQFGFYQNSLQLQYNYCDDSGTIVSGVSVNVGRWYHVVVSMQLTRTGAGNFYMYINGQLQGENSQQIYPSSVPRVSATLGFSNWGDAFFVGLIDTFNLYATALTSSQIVQLYQTAMLAPLSAVQLTSSGASTISATAPTPWFSAPFTTAPATSPSTAFSWLNQDSNDTACGINNHQGLLVLQGHDTPDFASGSIGPYVNLASSSGANSIGATLPASNIGGAGAGLLAQGTMGWTFEVMFKATLIEQWSKVFDIGNPQLANGQCQYDISLGWDYLGPTWQFNVCDGNGNGWAIVDAIGAVNVNQWYHAVVVIQALPSGAANYLTYVNGQLYTTLINGYYPANLARTDAYLARSDWAADSYWSGEVDLFNIYNVALTQQQIAALYATAAGGQSQPTFCPQTANSATAPPPLYFSATFQTDPRLPTVTNLGSSASYGWASYDTSDSPAAQAVHTGLLVLNGSLQSSAPNAGPYANLSATSGPNWIGQTLGVIGGLGSGSFTQSSMGWTYEVVFKPLAQVIWAKVFDIGNPGANVGCNYDVILGWNAATLGLQFDVCNAAVTQFQLFPPTALTLGTWYHAVVTQTLVPSGLSNYFVYINGALVGASYDQNYPIAAPRYNSVLGYSNWADPFWVGEIDLFNVYDQAVNQIQVYNMYVAAMQPTGATTPGLISGPSTAPAPWFGLSFDTSFSTSPSGWSYLAVDPQDSSCGITSHTGLLVLPGHTQPSLTESWLTSLNGPYVNLSTTGGTNGFSSQLPGNIGGNSTAGTIAAGTAGWTFEVAFKPTLVETWGKIFDLGQPQLANGNCQYDIILGWEGSGPTMQFDVCDGNGVQYQITDALGNVQLGQWYHAVVVVQQLASGLANYYTYVDGSLYTSLTSQYYPESVGRSNGNMGHSDWQADSYWAGEVDYFNIYNQALTPAQIAARYSSTFGTSPVTCTAVGNAQTTPPAPFFSLNFTVDPRVTTGLGSGANYSWVSGDSSDSQVDAALHSGLLYLAGSSQSSATQNGPYVNLSATSGGHWVGSTLGAFGGVGSGSVFNSTAGWSFEVTFKALSQTTWAKIFDLGDPQVPAGTCYYDVVLGWQASSTTLQFTICDQSAITPAQPIVLGAWYHAVAVLQLTVTGMANFFLYVNGELQGALTMQYYLVALPRVSAALGYSNWGDAFWNGYIDTFNIYSQSLNQQQVTQLYATAMLNISSQSAAVQAVSSTPPTPWFTAPFTNNVASSSTGFTWMQQDPSDVSCGVGSRTGLLVLPGRDTPVVGNTGVLPAPAYVNLASASGANSIGSTLPGNIGGASAGSVAAGTAGWTFEIAFKPTIIEQWAKLFDIEQPQLSNGACQYDILWGWNYLGSSWQFNVCDGNGNGYAIGDSLGPIQLGQWYHAVAVIQLLPSGLANYYTYVNGLLYGSLSNTYYPVSVSRPNAFMGRSGWGADSYWAGEVDLFNIYNQALTAAQVASAFTAQQSSQPACPPTQQLNSTIPSTSFSLTFAADPRSPAVTNLGSSASYSWVNTDTSDSAAAQAVHQGLLVLSGSAQSSAPNAGPYVNLSAVSGINWVGQTLTAFGGAGAGSLLLGTQGWSIEVTFKPTKQTPWAKIFDLGNGGGSSCLYDVILGWDWDTTKTQFDLCDASANQFQLFPNPTLTVGQWYHALVVMQLQVNGLATYNVYFNGQLAGSLSSQTYLLQAPRNNAGLGYSNWGDAFWVGEIDTFNIYPVAMNQL